MSKIVFSADDMHPAAQAKIHELGYDLTVINCDDEVLLENIIKIKPHVLIVRSTKVLEKHIDAGVKDNLKVIIRAGSGYNTIKFEYAGEKGVAVCNCPGKNAAAVAELAVGLMIAADRQIPAAHFASLEGKFDKKSFSKCGMGICGKTLGVLGKGHIAQRVWAAGKALGMKVVCCSRSLTDELAAELGVVKAENAIELAKVSDVISVHLPLKEGTKHLCGEEFFAAAKEGAIFIDVSRGGVTDLKALEKAIDTKGIRAALDVYEGEPKPTKGAMFPEDLAALCKKCIVATPHVGASTDEAQATTGLFCAEITQEFFEKGTFLCQVNKF
ncbi:hydroxyacid dehydrogenase [Aduncisulcus paluster]|uniref:Hydroxyacid dehydrogenase n=1 Tax=Aduncisulcus paluster TaxID=2918883 RepID=A0ABQ5JWU9_9EUKA|nr:hydroxyacid dehydrogenase [Aduncisulcus paluster]|eukprot:gnl/Carplike_NY0171/1069_a1460_1810.p1 GENE.gnl/Carplike_NY0171/1069_a1460_1810~~gnl/Carplike_NY0171/1069_a1460_1810.p1  ORF type:complete len:339 (+),score=148.79 gnl/Carplike_NY0171/1069_a1460_1810:34-1017(+)